VFNCLTKHCTALRVSEVSGQSKGLLSEGISIHSMAARAKLILGLLLVPLLLQSCKRGKEIYESDCDAGITFKHVDYNHLIDSLAYYDHKYIEISGRYQEGKEQSALFNSENIYRKRPRNVALWVNFSQDCPLYLAGTRIGLFEYNNGEFTQINNKKVRIRGKLDIHNKGHLKQYKGCIDRVSYIEL
jgi:hypothetical protein